MNSFASYICVQYWNSVAAENVIIWHCLPPTIAFYIDFSTMGNLPEGYIPSRLSMNEYSFSSGVKWNIMRLWFRCAASFGRFYFRKRSIQVYYTHWIILRLFTWIFSIILFQSDFIASQYFFYYLHRQFDSERLVFLFSITILCCSGRSVDASVDASVVFWQYGNVATTNWTGLFA